MNRLLYVSIAEKSAHRRGVERPVQFRAVAPPQYRYAKAIPRFERIVIVDPRRGELRKTRLGQYLQRKIAKVAVVSLEQGEFGHAQVYGVSGRQA
jgi:hypothetical protein